MGLLQKLPAERERKLRRSKKVGLADIMRARECIRPIIHETPLLHSRTFSEQTGNDVYLKMENLQKTGAFKIRGAANKVFNLSPVEASRGVIAASAGNHAQGVAWAATSRGIAATIVMPKGAPTAKIMATRGYGAEVVLHGHNYDEAYQYARYLQEERGLTFVHAFDDAQVISGQGTIALEIIDQLPEVEALLVPIGGGGLAAGVAIAAKEINPRLRVIGVQAAGAPSMYQSRQKNSRQQLAAVKTIADGIAVKEPGRQTFEYVQKYVDEIVLVDESDIADSIVALLERGKVMAEGAGVVGLAALLSERVYIRGAKVAVLISGGNMDPLRLSEIITGTYV